VTGDVRLAGRGIDEEAQEHARLQRLNHPAAATLVGMSPQGFGSCRSDQLLIDDV
jgi:hypothetical protein